MQADADIRLKRARMRAWHRGMKEMDLLLGRFIDARGAHLDADRLEMFERLMQRDDRQLYAWIASGDAARPEDALPQETELVAEIAEISNETANCARSD